MTTNQPESQVLNVGHMTYLNSEVFYRQLPVESCVLVPMPPRAMAAAVERGDLHAGPLPIAEVMRLGDSVRSLGDMGVACDGPALSVILFSNSPVESLSSASIAVTSHTATSIQLLRVLFADLWNVKGHQFVEMTDEHEAALIIGDPALEKLTTGSYPYQYDLGEAWKTLTGLPFVFAEWVVRADAPIALADNFEQALIAATRNGIESVEEISRLRSNDSMSESDVSKYVQNFSYFFGPDDRAGQLEFKRRLEKLPEWRPLSPASKESSTEKAIPTS
ncbi:menaquinone biosynthesis protein [Dehalococcoides mccartyi]|nr:menaquinone biosynthesis protein [Dehalococcoides mccartyi]